MSKMNIFNFDSRNRALIWQVFRARSILYVLSSRCPLAHHSSLEGWHRTPEIKTKISILEIYRNITISPFKGVINKRRPKLEGFKDIPEKYYNVFYGCSPMQPCTAHKYQRMIKKDNSSIHQLLITVLNRKKPDELN